MVRFLALVFLFGSVLAGCGFHYTYNKPGVSAQERARDDYQCRQESRGYSMVGTGNVVAAGDSLNWELYKPCMEARGYTVKEGRDEEVNVSVPTSRTAASTPQTTPEANANIRTAEDVRTSLYFSRQFLDRKVAAGELTQEEASRQYQERERVLTKKLNQGR